MRDLRRHQPLRAVAHGAQEIRTLRDRAILRVGDAGARADFPARDRVCAGAGIAQRVRVERAIAGVGVGREFVDARCAGRLVVARAEQDVLDRAPAAVDLVGRLRLRDARIFRAADRRTDAQVADERLVADQRHVDLAVQVGGFVRQGRRRRAEGGLVRGIGAGAVGVAAVFAAQRDVDALGRERALQAVFAEIAADVRIADPLLVAFAEHAAALRIGQIVHRGGTWPVGREDVERDTAWVGSVDGRDAGRRAVDVDHLQRVGDLGRIDPAGLLLAVQRGRIDPADIVVPGAAEIAANARHRAIDLVRRPRRLRFGEAITHVGADVRAGAGRRSAQRTRLLRGQQGVVAVDVVRRRAGLDGRGIRLALRLGSQVQPVRVELDRLGDFVIQERRAVVALVLALEIEAVIVVIAVRARERHELAAAIGCVGQDAAILRRPRKRLEIPSRSGGRRRCADHRLARQGDRADRERAGRRQHGFGLAVCAEHRDVAAAAGEVLAHADIGIEPPAIVGHAAGDRKPRIARCLRGDVVAVVGVVEAVVDVRVDPFEVLAEDEIHHPADRIRAIDRGGAAGQQVDALDQPDRHDGGVDTFGDADPLAVDQRERPVGAQPVEIELLASVAVRQIGIAVLDRGDAVQHLLDAERRLQLDVGLRDAGHRCGLDEVLRPDARPGHDDVAAGRWRGGGVDFGIGRRAILGGSRHRHRDPGERGGAGDHIHPLAGPRHREAAALEQAADRRVRRHRAVDGRGNATTERRFVEHHLHMHLTTEQPQRGPQRLCLDIDADHPLGLRRLRLRRRDRHHRRDSRAACTENHALRHSHQPPPRHVILL